MKFSTSALLISAALATIASAVPLTSETTVNTGPIITKRCSDCTSTDGVALDIIVKASADHYSTIAQARLNTLMSDMEAAKVVTTGDKNLPQEKALLNVAVQAKIDQAKEACTPEALAPVIKATVSSDANLDVAWSKEEEIKKKMAELDLMITKLMLERIQVNIDAELLSKDCTEKMTNTEIAPAPAAPPAPEPAPVEAEPEPAAVPDPAPAPAPASGPQPGIDVAASVDSKYVCKSGCKDSADANTVLSLRVNLENEFKPRLNQFYVEEVPKECEEKRESLLGGVLKLVAELDVKS